MPTELETRYWWAKPESFVARFQQIVQCMQQISPSISWVRTSLIERFPWKSHEIEEGLASAPHIEETLKQLGNSKSPRTLKAQFSIPLWRFSDKQIEQGFLLGGVEVWEAVAERVGETIEIEGHALIYFSSGGPFTALIEPNDNLSQEINVHVEENIETLLNLLLGVFTSTNATKALALDAVGWKLPCNSHLSLYADKLYAQEDSALLVRIWKFGIGNYEPLSKITPDKLEDALHPWRSHLQRQRLYQQMSELSEIAPPFNWDTKQILSSTELDEISLSNGFGVINFPYLLNSFVDQFYFSSVHSDINH